MMGVSVYCVRAWVRGVCEGVWGWGVWGGVGWGVCGGMWVCGGRLQKGMEYYCFILLKNMLDMLQMSIKMKCGWPQWPQWPQMAASS